MSTITKTFYSLAGTQYRLTISGSTVTGSESFELSADPIRLSFAKGKHKFVPLRTWEMKIGLITSADLSHLYSDTPISTTVTLEKNVSGTWKFVFYGFLEPLTYNQPFTGMQDNITLTAVDALTAYAYKYYSMTGTGIQYRTETSYLCSICREIGISDIIVAPASSNPFGQQIAESAFLTTDFDSGEATYADVVGAIMARHGYTAMCWGKYLFCVDMANASISSCIWIGCSDQSVTSGQWSYFAPDFTLNGSSLRDTDMQISIEQAYGRVVVKPHGAARGMVVPSIFRNATIYQGCGYEMSVDNGTRQFRVDLLQNTGINFWAWDYRYVSSYPESKFQDGTISLHTDSNTWYGAVPLRFSYWGLGDNFNGVTTRDAIFIRNGHPGTATSTGKKLFELKPAWRGHIAGKFKVSCTVASRTRHDYIYPPMLGGADDDPSMTAAEEGIVTIPGLYIKVGDYYYKFSAGTSFDNGAWSQGSGAAPMSFGKSTDKAEKQIGQSQTGLSYYETGWIGNFPSGVSTNSPIEVYCETAYPNNGRGFWIFDFKIENDYSILGDEWMSRTINNQNNSDEMSADAWFDKSSGSAYGGGYGNDILLDKLHNRYSNKHRAIQFTGTSAIQPFSAVIDGTNGNSRLTIDSMDWDVRNDKCRVYCS